MTDILRLLFIVLLLTVSLAAYFLVVGAFFPNRVDKSQRALNQMAGRAFGVGLVNFLFFGVLAIVLFSVAESTNGLIQVILTFPALIITGFLTVLLTFGLAGTVRELGARLFPEQTAWRQTVWGSAVLTLACALPLVGWFVLLPAVAVISIGATILGFFQRDS